MATIVCHQGLRSCLEPQPIEPRALRLTLSSTRPLESASKSCSVKPEPGSWSVIEALFDSPKLSNEIEGKEIIYVHPLEKRSWSALSDKSLGLCTENLGSETGSDDVLEDDVFSSSSSYSYSSNQGNEDVHAWKELRGTKGIGGDFPPPLTTISGSESIRVRSHRENGRLVMKAEKAPSRNSVFQGERSNGRLRLYSTSIVDYENDIDDNNKEEEEEEFGNDDDMYVTEEEGGERAETTTFQRRDGGGGGRGRCKGGERGGFLGGGCIHSFIVDFPVE